jgi:HK97 gp10 family phage protein
MRVELKGLADVRRALEELADVANAENVGNALTEAAAPVLDAAQSRAPAGRIAGALDIIGPDVNSDGNTAVVVGIPKDHPEASHATLVEFGTGPRVQANGRRTGSMPAKPFLRPAIDTQAASAFGKFGEFIKRLVEGIRR